ARGAVTRRRRFRSRSVDLTLAYLQLLAIPDPMGLAFEVRPTGELRRLLRAHPVRVDVVDSRGRPRSVSERKFTFSPLPGAKVGIDVTRTNGLPRLVMNFVRPNEASDSGKWREQAEFLLHMGGCDSVQVLIRKLRVVTLGN